MTISSFCVLPQHTRLFSELAVTGSAIRRQLLVERVENNGRKWQLSILQ